MDATLQRKLEAILDRQIVLGIESIFSAVYSGPGIETLSFFHILNRIMMLVQLPITFIVMKQRGDGSFEEYFRTNHHERHTPEIDRAIKTANADHYFPLWYSTANKEHFSLLVLKAEKNYKFAQLLKTTQLGKINDGSGFKKDSINSWSIGSYKLQAVLKVEAYNHYGHFIGNVVQSIKNTKINIDDATRNDNLKKGAEEKVEKDLEVAVKNKFDRNLLSNTTELYENLKKRGVLDKVFRKIAKNILDIDLNGRDKKSSKNPLTNFLLFSRDYYKTPSLELRHTYYDYSLRVLLCDSQREEIENFLRNLIKEKKTRRARFKNELKTVSEAKAKKLSMEVDELFWSILGRDDDRGIIELTDILAEYFGETSRSMADPVFDGLSFYRQPFANDGGMARCFLPESNYSANIADLPLGSIIRKDLLRVILCQYLFDGMAAYHVKKDSEDLQLQVMLNPIEVGGRVWGVVAYATRSHSLEKEFSNNRDLLLYEFYWSKNYHIYRDVNERLKKNLRSYMNTFYEQFVASLYDDWIIFIETDPNAKDVTLRVLEDWINQALRSLSCIFPYDVVQVALKRVPSERFPVPSSDVSGGEFRAMAGRHWAAHVTVVGQSMFPVAPGVKAGATRGFVDATDVAVAMTDRLFRGAYSKAKPTDIHDEK